MKFGIFGLGEAGSLIAADLAGSAPVVTAYDPADVGTPPGVHRTDNPAEVAGDADIILSITASYDAHTAIMQAVDEISPTCLYADLSSSSPGLMEKLAGIAVERRFEFLDVAMMSTVPGKGIRTPSIVAGRCADRFVSAMGPHGMQLTVVGEVPGDAVRRKLLRSIMMKGLAGTVIEAMRAAEKADLGDWLWRNLADEITAADEALLSRLVRGSGPHAVRRRHEMEAAEGMLVELGIDPVMTRATIENLRRLKEDGLPEVPELPDSPGTQEP